MQNVRSNTCKRSISAMTQRPFLVCCSAVGCRARETGCQDRQGTKL